MSQGFHGLNSLMSYVAIGLADVTPPGGPGTQMSRLLKGLRGGKRVGAAGRLVDLLEQPDEMAAGDAQLDCGAASVPAVSRERREHFLALEHVDLTAQTPRWIRLQHRSGAGVEDRHQRPTIEELLATRAKEDRLDLVLQLADVSEPGKRYQIVHRVLGEDDLPPFAG